MTPYLFSTLRTLTFLPLALFFLCFFYLEPVSLQPLLSKTSIHFEHGRHDSIFTALLYCAFLLYYAGVFALGKLRRLKAVILFAIFLLLFSFGPDVAIILLTPYLILFLYFALVPGQEPWSLSKKPTSALETKFSEENVHLALLGYGIFFLLYTPSTLTLVYLLPALLLPLSYWQQKVHLKKWGLFFWGLSWLSWTAFFASFLTGANWIAPSMALLINHLLVFRSSWLPAKREEEAILFFDGVCGLCSEFVDFLFAEDSGGVFQVATLQGDTAKKRLESSDIEELNSLVVLINGTPHRRSQAVIHILSRIGGLWSLARVFCVLPPALLDKIYDFVAHRRYKIFGQKDTCRLPTPEERRRFLD